MLLVEGGVQMFICFVVVAAVMGSSLNKTTGYILYWVHIVQFWPLIASSPLVLPGPGGPLGWLIPSEFHNIETQGTGQAITVCINFIFSFVIDQAYLTMLCK